MVQKSFKIDFKWTKVGPTGPTSCHEIAQKSKCGFHDCIDDRISFWIEQFGEPLNEALANGIHGNLEALNKGSFFTHYQIALKPCKWESY